jgi:hypothetical protein
MNRTITNQLVRLLFAAGLPLLPFGNTVATEPLTSSLLLKGAAGLTESSGLAFSTSDPHCVWTHNDSGDTARLFCYDTRTGELTGQCTLVGAESVDWEALTTAGVDEHELVVADCGDNLANRDHITLYRFAQPDPHQTSHLNQQQYQALSVRFPDGAVDCEAVWYDAAEASVILLAKSRLPFAAVYCVPDRLWDSPVNATDKTVTAIRISTLNIPMATGADRDPVSGDVWVANYFQAFCFRRGEHVTLATQLATIPDAFEMPRLRQIEAIAVDRHSNVWVTSEGVPALLAMVEK